VSPVASERADHIRAYIQEHPFSKIDERWPMEFGGIIRYQPVYDIPINLLCYNLKNGRYAVELAKLQADESYQLDPTRATDHEKLRSLLLSLDPEQTEALKEDIRQRGQIYPGVITQDGFVINANRRMAVLEKLHQAEPGGKFEKLKVQVLPDDVDDRDLWRLEAGLQLSRDTRADYSPINELLKLREGRDAGLKPTEIAAAMYGRKATWVEESLGRLDTMEQYLSYFGLDHGYHHLEGTNEQFIELQKNLKALEREGLDAEERYDWLICQFQLIRAGVSNWDLRDVKKIALDHDAQDRLQEEVIAKSQPGSALPQASVLAAFDAAQNTIKSKEEATRPGVLLQRAVAALDAITPDNPHLVADRNNKYLFKKLRSHVKKLEKILG
jgi:hypothetical protein